MSYLLKSFSSAECIHPPLVDTFKRRSSFSIVMYSSAALLSADMKEDAVSTTASPSTALSATYVVSSEIEDALPKKSATTSGSSIAKPSALGKSACICALSDSTCCIESCILFRSRNCSAFGCCVTIKAIITTAMRRKPVIVFLSICILYCNYTIDIVLFLIYFFLLFLITADIKLIKSGLGEITVLLYSG